jgi:hypothetical protein
MYIAAQNKPKDNFITASRQAPCHLASKRKGWLRAAPSVWVLVGSYKCGVGLQ